jgi:hypothetical protein
VTEDAGLEFLLLVGRWIGFGGDSDFQGSTLDTITCAAALERRAPAAAAAPGSNCVESSIAILVGSQSMSLLTCGAIMPL